MTVRFLQSQKAYSGTISITLHVIVWKKGTNNIKEKTFNHLSIKKKYSEEQKLHLPFIFTCYAQTRFQFFSSTI